MSFLFTENFRVWDTEWEIPVPAKGGERDYNLIQRAWCVFQSSTSSTGVALIEMVQRCEQVGRHHGDVRESRRASARCS